MQRVLALFAALLLAATTARATDGNARNLAKLPGPLSKNGSMYFSVLFTGFTINGQNETGKVMALKTKKDNLPAAMWVGFGEEGLPVLRADYDSAFITVKAVAPPLPTAKSTSVFACYAKASLYDRGWRKPNNNTELDKQCPWAIKEDMPVSGGTVEWTPNPETPKGIYFLRAYQMCSTPDSDELVPCAIGHSPGVVQVEPIQTHPANLIGATVACMFAGPLCLVGWYIYESKFKKSAEYH